MGTSKNHVYAYTVKESVQESCVCIYCARIMCMQCKNHVYAYTVKRLQCKNHVYAYTVKMLFLWELELFP